MADQFTLSGSYTTTPLDGVPSLDPNIDAPMDENMVLSKKRVDVIDLTSDSPVAVSFGGLDYANVAIVKVVAGKVKASFTSTDGATQAVPVDDMMILKSLSVPVTALTLTRVPATPVQVRVFLGQVAS